MRKLIELLVVLLLLSSCQPFSNKEKTILLDSKVLISNVISQRLNEANEAISRMDRIIYEEGNKDRRLYTELNDKLRILSSYDLTDQKNRTIIRDIVPDAALIPEFPQVMFNCYEPLDSVLKQSWAVSLKENVVYNYTFRVGASCCFCFNIIKPFVECESSEIQQGQPYKATFYLGELLRSKIEGPGVINNEIKYQPEPIEGKHLWKGKAIYFRDTIDVEIPYEIVSCNEFEHI